jgi:acyl-CoA thioesterase
MRDMVHKPGDHPFDQATRVTLRDGRRTGQTSEGYRAFVGPFGGITAATILRALVEHPDAAGDPLAFTVNFCAPIAAGTFDLALRLVKANRSTQHWSVELTQDEVGVAALATAVFAQRRPTWSHQPAGLPAATPFAETAVYPDRSAAPWIGQFEFRFADGEPSFRDGPHDEPASAHSKVWIANAVPRPIDAVSLAAIADAFFARIFHVRGELVPIGTVSMTTYFHADAADLKAENATAVLGVADAKIFHKSYGDQTGELWSASGRLLATTHQITYFKA